VLHCAGNELSSVDVCLSHATQYRDCSATLQDQCPSKIMMRPARLKSRGS
jgi:ribonuclease I